MRATVIIFCGFLAVALAQQTSTTTRRPTNSTTATPPRPRPPPQRRGPRPAIVLGEDAQEGEFPYQAHIYSSVEGADSGNICGGSLIAPNWILTAAHCVSDDFSYVSFGSVDTTQMTYSEAATQRIIHPEYEPILLANDIALMKLPSNPQGPNIAVGRLGGPELGELANVPVIASGFGRLHDDGPYPQVLQKVNLMTITNEECSGPHPYVTENNICTTWINQPGESACVGDSGGPLNYNDNGENIVIGVASFVGASCESGDPTGFVRTAPFLDWIATTIANN